MRPKLGGTVLFRNATGFPHNIPQGVSGGPGPKNPGGRNITAALGDENGVNESGRNGVVFHWAFSSDLTVLGLNRTACGNCMTDRVY